MAIAEAQAHQVEKKKKKLLSLSFILATLSLLSPFHQQTQSQGQTQS